MSSDAPATPLPCRGGVAVGRGGVCNLSHAEAQREQRERPLATKRETEETESDLWSLIPKL